jgi:hypothetical protein
MSQKLTLIGTTFIERSPAAKAGFFNLINSRYKGLSIRELTISVLSSPKHYLKLN